MSQKVISYVEELIKAKSVEEKAQVEAKGGESVTLLEVGNAFQYFISELATYVDTAQAVMEVRLLAVIESLPLEVQQEIKKKFDEAEDDLINNIESEGEKH